MIDDVLNGRSRGTAEIIDLRARLVEVMREFGGHDVVHAIGGIGAVQHDPRDRAGLLEGQGLVFAHGRNVIRWPRPVSQSVG